MHHSRQVPVSMVETVVANIVGQTGIPDLRNHIREDLGNDISFHGRLVAVIGTWCLDHVCVGKHVGDMACDLGLNQPDGGILLVRHDRKERVIQADPHDEAFPTVETFGCWRHDLAQRGRD